MNEDCSKMSCGVPKNAVQDYLNQYSLNQVVVKNSEFVAVINGISVTIPAGTFEYPISESTGSFSPITFQGCQSLISVPIPSGSSFSDIQALVQSMLNQAAQQQAQCNAASVPAAPAFLNQQVSIESACTDDPLSISSTLPPGVAQSGNSLVCESGVFASSVSQSDANNLAVSFLVNLLANLFTTGAARCGVGNYEPWSYTFPDPGWAGSNPSPGVVQLTSPAPSGFAQASTALVILTAPFTLHVNIVFDTTAAGVEIGTTVGGDDVFNPGNQFVSPYDVDVTLPAGSYYIGIYANNSLGAGKVATGTLTPSHY
jgi:hypothetical protein